MSRARLFQRAAQWLKQCIQTKNQAELNKERRRAFQFAFGQLEERVVLDADFTFDGVNLRLDDFSSLGGEALDVSDTATHFEFTLSEGTWSGVDSGLDVVGNGSNILTVTKNFGGTSIISDAPGIDTSFSGVNFDEAGTLNEVGFIGNDMSQSGGIVADSIAQVSFEGNDLVLTDPGNDFNEITLDASTVSLADVDDITLADITISNSLSVTAAGNILLADDIDIPKVHLDAGAGVDQQTSTFLSTMELLLEGNGDFNLVEANRIGESFTPGQVAADIDGSLTLNNEFDLQFDNLTYGAVTIDGINIDAGSSTGNLIVTTSQDDVLQDIGAKVEVEGKASFDVGIGTIVLSNLVDNDFNEVEILNADEAEIATGANGMTILEVTVDDQFAIFSQGSVLLKDTINAGARLGLFSFDGVFQDISSVINAEELIVFGGGDFSLKQANNIQNLAGLGQIAVDVDGNFELENGVATEVESLVYDFVADLPAISVDGIDATGDFMIELPDADFTQATDSAFVVDGTATFSLGTGVLNLPFANESLGIVNENDFGIVAIASASVVDLVDEDGFIIGDSVISDRARFEATNGDIVIDRDLRATNQILFVAGDGMGQILGASIESPEVMFYGSGDFVLDQLNALGTSGVNAQIAAMIDGSLELKNDFGVNISTLTYTNLDASTLEIVGVTMDDTTGSGDIKFDIDEASVTQDDDSPIIVAGLTTFDVGTTGTVNLPFADTIIEAPGLEEFVNENDFNTVAVDDGDTVELNDINSVTIIGAFTNNRLSVTSDTENIVLDGNINVANIVKFDAQTGLQQTGGVIDGQSLLAFGEGYFDFAQVNSLGGVTSGVIAADINGDLNFVNAEKVQIGSLSYTDLNGVTSTAFGVGATDTSVLDNFRLRADGIEMWQRATANTSFLNPPTGSPNSTPKPPTACWKHGISRSLEPVSSI